MPRRVFRHSGIFFLRNGRAARFLGVEIQGKGSTYDPNTMDVIEQLVRDGFDASEEDLLPHSRQLPAVNSLNICPTPLSFTGCVVGRLHLLRLLRCALRSKSAHERRVRHLLGEHSIAWPAWLQG